MSYWHSDWDGSEMDRLLGKTFTSVTRSSCNGEDAIVFENADEKFALYHDQDCCEDVGIEDIVGDLSDLEGTPILLSERTTNHSDEPPKSDYPPDSYTWTFFKFATVKGHVTIRFFGESNGYYSEDAKLHYQGE